jgi:hypothetical protein
MKHTYLLFALCLLSSVCATITTQLPSGIYGVNSQIPLTLELSQPFSLDITGGTPTLKVFSSVATYVSHTSQSISFVYVVQASDVGSVSIQSFDANGSVLNISVSSDDLSVLSPPTIDGAQVGEPSISIGSTTVFNSSSVVIPFSSNGQVQATFMGETISCCSLSRTLLDGTYTISFSAVRAGLTSSTTRQFVVDTLAPTISSIRVDNIVIESSHSLTASSPVFLVETEANATISYIVNGQATSAVTLLAGKNSVTVVACDSAQNCAQKSLNLTRVSPINMNLLYTQLASRGIGLKVLASGIDVTGNTLLDSTLFVDMYFTSALLDITVLNVSLSQFASSVVPQLIQSPGEYSVAFLGLSQLIGSHSLVTYAIHKPFNSSITISSFENTPLSRSQFSLNQTSAFFTSSQLYDGFVYTVDTLAPTITSFSVSSTYADGVIVVVNTSEFTICKLSTIPGNYSSMPAQIQTSVAQTSHVIYIRGLTSSTGYTYYASCSDLQSNSMVSSQSVAFMTSTSGAIPAEPSQSQTTTPDQQTQPAQTYTSHDDILRFFSLEPSDFSKMEQDESDSVKVSTFSNRFVLTDASSVFDSYGLQTGTCRITATTYESKKGKTTQKYTVFDARVDLNSLPSNTFYVAFVFPSLDSSVYGDVSVDSAVIYDSFKARSVDNNRVTVRFGIKGDYLSYLPRLSCFVVDKSIQVETPTSSSTTGASKPSTKPSVGAVNTTNTSGVSLTQSQANTLLPLIGVFVVLVVLLGWFVFSQNTSGVSPSKKSPLSRGVLSGSSGSFFKQHSRYNSSGLYREDFVHKKR